MSGNEVVDNRRRVPCPISRSEFMASAVAIPVDVMGKKLSAEVDDFKPDDSGRSAFGWICKESGAIQFGDISVPVTIKIQIACVGSKDASP